nr:ChbG/HpnK family deacetylase [Allomuricauda sp.]
MAYLIINADDFGMSDHFNGSIIQLLLEKKITSTTVMVNRISDSQAATVKELKYLNGYSDISVGLHVEFTYDKHKEQVEGQYQKFIDIFGIAPSHLDVHKEHLHTKYHSIVAKFCREKGLPFRNHGKAFRGVVMPDKKYFYGSVEDFSEIDDWLKGLKKGKTYELVFHPGTYDPSCYSSLNRDRQWDIDHIGRIHRDYLNYNFDLINFNDLKKD